MTRSSRTSESGFSSEVAAPRTVASQLLDIRAAVVRRMHAYRDLTKLRLSTLVLVVTAVGYVLGTTGPLDVWLLVHTVLGTALVAFGANSLNQVWERDHDRLMSRTRGRPIPSGRIDVTEAAAFGVSAAVIGLVYLSVSAGAAATALATATIALYLFAYTPLKRRTPLNTLVGAVPGALPPLIGYVAAAGRIDVAACSIFAIVFVWQLPHFYAISWIHRADYAAAKYTMLSTTDPSGRTLAYHTAVSAGALAGVSLLPRWVGLAGNTYVVGAGILGLALFAVALWFAARLSCSTARMLLAASLVFLPAVMVLMVVDKAVGAAF